MSNPLKVGSNAPLFTASSTQGLINLEDYKGQWLVLFCNPTEFNTARRNEYIYLMKHAKIFRSQGIQLLSISTDSKAGHLPWFYSNTKYGSNDIPFPIIDDRDQSLIRKYDIKPANNMRSSNMQVIVISPEQTIAKTLNYPALNNTALKDIYNNVVTLQQADTSRALTMPCNVQPIVGEYVLGNPSNVDATLLDFVIYAFALINPDGKFTVYSTRYLRDMSALKNENPNLKIIMAIGGWGADGFSDAALTPTSRYAFAREAQRWVREYNLDGIDIDWEYPGSSASGIKSRPQDRENFTLLLTALRDVLGDDKWISVAGTGESTYLRNVEIAKISPIIDHFNLMAYDYTAGVSGTSGNRHQSNLYPSPLALNNMSVSGQIDALINAGMKREKILMGIPFYGRRGMSDTKTYDELRRNYLNKNGYRVKWDNIAKAPYIVDSNGNFAYSYDNLLSIYYKGLYVAENCLGGLFSWQSGMDRANILASGMSQAVRDIDQLEELLKQAYYGSQN